MGKQGSLSPEGAQRAGVEAAQYQDQLGRDRDQGALDASSQVDHATGTGDEVAADHERITVSFSAGWHRRIASGSAAR